MKIGDLVRYRSKQDCHREWLGIIVREIPGIDEIKVIEWTHRNKGKDRGSYRARDLVLANENR
tara:strand:- start:1480 stop:1668 length:189 start_codon:yes stop_codon:yes gene_type:complete